MRARLRGLLRDVTLAGFAGGAADVVCQRLERHTDSSRKDDVFEVQRTCAFAAFTGLYIGGACTALYSTYPRIAKWVLSKPSAKAVGAVSTLLDNFVHVPFFYMPAFYIGTCTLRGEDWSTTKQCLDANWLESVTSCWAFWIPAQFAIFSVVPAVYRVRCVACGDFVWNVVLSYLAHRSQPMEVEIASGECDATEPRDPQTSDS